MAGIRPVDGTSGCEFIFYSSLDLTPLASLTDIDKEKLIGSTYPLVSREGLPKYTILAYGTTLPQYMVRMRPTKICPACLVEANYCRRIWDLAPVTVCPIHECMLLDECQRCKRLITWHRSKVSVCPCKFDWRASVTKPLDKKEAELTRQIYKLCGLSGGQIETTKSANNPLFRLALRQLLSAMFFISGQLCGVVDSKGKFLASKLRNFELHSLLNRSYSVFDDWPDRFYQFLEWKRTQRKERVGAGLIHDFGKFYRYLYNEFSGDSFNFIRDAFEEYIRLYWSGGHTSRITRFSGGDMRSKKYITRDEAKRRLCVQDIVLQRLIDAGDLKAILLSGKQKTLTLIELADVERLESDFNQALSLNQALALLGVGRRLILKLVKHGCLAALRRPLTDVGDVWRFSLREVNNLLENIRAKINPSEPLSLNEVITFRTAQQKLAVRDVKSGQFVQAMLKGEITSCGEGTGIGLSRLLFRQDNIDSYVKMQLKQKQGPLTVKEASCTYKIAENTIRELIDQGIIPAIKIPTNRRANIFISQKTIEHFKETYVLASEVAVCVAAHPNRIIRLLVAKGIKPVVRYSGGKRCPTVFKKMDLEKVDLRAEILEARGQYCRTNHKTKILTMEQVATLLGINTGTVCRLADGGFLKPYSGSSIEGDAAHYFTSRALEGCKSKVSSYTGLLSEPMVKQIIRQDPTGFYIVKVKKGGSKEVASEAGGNTYQVRVMNVGALITLLGQTTTRPEVRIKWGVEARTLNRWIFSGTLKTISKSANAKFNYHLFLVRDIERLQQSAA